VNSSTPAESSARASGEVARLGARFLLQVFLEAQVAEHLRLYKASPREGVGDAAVD